MLFRSPKESGPVTEPAESISEDYSETEVLKSKKKTVWKNLLSLQIKGSEV